MAKTHTIGLDIGSHGIYAVELVQRRGRVELVNFGGVPLPDAAVHEGEILEPDTVTAAIRQLWKDMRLRSKDVWLGVANQRVVVRSVEMTAIEEDEMSSALPFEAREHIPMGVEESLLDFARMSTRTTDDGAELMRGLLVAAHRELIGSLVDAVTGAKLVPRAVDLNGFAVLRTVLANSDKAQWSQTAEAVVDIGAGVTDVVVHDRGNPVFVRSLEAGSSDITEALMSGLGKDVEAAERIKVSTGLQEQARDPAARIVEQRAGRIVEDVRETLEFHRSESDGLDVSRVWLCGGGALLQGLSGRMADELGVPVEHVRPLRNVPATKTSYSDEELAEIEPVLCSALGLALGGLGASG